MPRMTSAERIEFASLPRGSLVYVQTKNRHYWIRCLGGGAIRIAGHPEYCPTPAAARVFESGLVERGERFRFLLHEVQGRNAKFFTLRNNSSSKQPVAALFLNP